MRYDFLDLEKKIAKPTMITAMPIACCREMVSLKIK